jgi:hypothetical protein
VKSVMQEMDEMRSAVEEVEVVAVLVWARLHPEPLSECRCVSRSNPVDSPTRPR